MTTLEPSIAAHRVGHHLAGGHRKAQEEIVVAQRIEHGLQFRAELFGTDEESTKQQQRGGGVAAVQLVTHRQCAGHDRLEPHRFGLGIDQRVQRGCDAQPQVLQVFPGGVGVCAVVEAVGAVTFIKGAVRAFTAAIVCHHQDRHRRRGDAGQRADATEFLTPPHGDVSALEGFDSCTLVGRQPFVERSSDDRRALATGVRVERHRRTRGEDGRFRKPHGAFGAFDPHQHRVGSEERLDRGRVGSLAGISHLYASVLKRFGKRDAGTDSVILRVKLMCGQGGDLSQMVLARPGVTLVTY